MLDFIVKDKWTYEIKENFINYGYKAIIYKNNVEFKSQSGFGSPANAQVWVRDIFLFEEFGIDRER